MSESNMVDIMLENEQKNAADRIQNLEIRVQQQSDELICLKSALADLIRRMQNVENVQQQNKHQIYNQSQHHNKPTTSIKSNIKKSNKDFDTRSLGSVSQSISDNLSSSVKDTSRSSIARVAISSKSNSTERLSQIKSLQPAASAVSLKQTHATGEIIFNPDSGLVKFFLRGRPVNFYTNQMATNSNEMGFVFDLESKLKAPKQELKLEWVYGYRGKDCRSNLYQLPTGK